MRDVSKGAGGVGDLKKNVHMTFLVAKIDMRRFPKYSQSILANIVNSYKCILNFNQIKDSFRDAIFVATKIEIPKQRPKTFTSNTLSWHRHVYKTIRPILLSARITNSFQH